MHNPPGVRLGERIECFGHGLFLSSLTPTARARCIVVEREATVGSGAFHHGSASLIGAAGTSVATETYGHVSPAKFSDTFWLY
jgi:hypothetical protein